VPHPSPFFWRRVGYHEAGSPIRDRSLCAT
jgi:hypothetical protein